MPSSITYTNPVYPHYFADPFVLKVDKDYWAYGTAPADRDGKQFPVLHSTNLVHWRHVSHALAPISGGVNYWAPEVAYHNGTFFLFYSATTSASDEHHRLRVATSPKPDGPFKDSGAILMPDHGFSIDAHPFQDPKTRKWYLYFACDYTDDEPHGTGLAVVPMSDDLLSVAGKPQLVVRASCPWQVYEYNRQYKGRDWKAWHCVEGPFVLYREDPALSERSESKGKTGKYYCLYSGGAWHSQNYGLGFATADNPLGPWTDDYAKHGPTVLKGTPEEVIGPGHNSVVMGPDDQTLFCVYHAWDKAKTARRMCIDPISWTKDGPKCDGPSHTQRTVILR